jgi:N-acetylmuramoyl-L-alanine amidase
MNNPNPFVPKGSILEQQSKRRSRLKLTVFCVLAVSVAGLAAMLIQGCKREQPADTTDNSTPTIDTNPPVIADTNPPAVDTNPPVVTPPVAVTPPVIVPPVETAGAEYVIVQGDTLGKIAKKNGVTLKALEAANPGVVPTKLKVGQKISIPAGDGGAAASAAATMDSTGAGAGGDVYVVKSGDTLTKIAKHYGTTVKAIQSENSLSTTRIIVGQKLKIPAKAESAAPVAAAPEPAPVAPAPVAPATPPSTAPAQ